MSSEDQVRPYHAKTGSETADTLADVLEHAAAKEEASRKKTAPKKQPRWKMPLGVNLGVFAVYLIIGQPDWADMNPIEGPPVAVQEAGLRRAILLVANQIDAFQLSNGRLPSTLAEIGRDYPGWSYETVAGGEYRLTGVQGEVVLPYESTLDINEWAGDAGLGFGG